MRMTLFFVTLWQLLAPVAGWAHRATAVEPQVSFKATELAPGLHVLEGVGGFAGGNVCLLVGTDGVVMVDDSFPPFASTLLESVAKLAGAPLDFVINTHVHFDHVGGNQLVAEVGATIVAHDKVRARLVRDGIVSGPDPGPVHQAALPVLTFADAVTVHLNGQEIYVFHVAAAHTDGDAIIHFRGANVIHAGDVFFHGLFPFIDLDSGGSVDGYIAAQKRLIGIADDATKIIPGHGPMATRADLEASVAMLEEAKAIIGGLAAQGLSVEQVLEKRPLAAYENQSWDFVTTERMVRQVYRGLADG